MRVKKKFLPPKINTKNDFFRLKKMKNSFFSKNLTSVIWPHIGGCSHSGGGQLDTRRTFGSIRFIYVLLLASVVYVNMSIDNEYL